jgi:hypothetical protein
MPEREEADSPMPRVLLHSPRRVRRKRGTMGPLLLGRILTAPVLVVFAGMLGLVVLDWFVVFIVPAQPARIVGQIRQFKARQGATFFIAYQFDRSGFIGRDEVMPYEFQPLWVGRAVKAHVIHIGPVGYSALDRSLGDYAQNRMILWFGAVFALAIGGVIFQALWLAPWRSWWLTRNGQATYGAVVGKSIIHRRRRYLYFTLTYQFKVKGILQARRIRISPQRYDSTGVRDLLIILFDPARPRRSIVYDYCDFIALSSRAKGRVI